MDEASDETKDWGEWILWVSFELIHLKPTLVLHACTPANENMYWLWKPIVLEAQIHACRVQAWPLPLTGAGLTQNLHQAAVDETVRKQVKST